MNITDFMYWLILPLLCAGVLLAFGRLVRGPTLADRVVATDVIGTFTIGIIATYAVAAGDAVLLDVAVVLALILFLGTVAFAHYLERRVQS
jgi:multicomponent Na+:H+ antiporter subunit F